MDDSSQILVADSFIALYTQRGRLTVKRPELAERYETCEDLAQQVAEFCRTLQFGRDLSEDQALRQCHQGLLTPPTAVSPDEAAWVIRRVAELQNWDLPTWPELPPLPPTP